jgi:hypothetical protein
MKKCDEREFSPPNLTHRVHNGTCPNERDSEDEETHMPAHKHFREKYFAGFRPQKPHQEVDAAP